MKNLLLGVILPILLVVSGLGLLIILRVPEPARAHLPDPRNEGELLAFLPIAEVAEVKYLADTLNIAVSGTVVPYREIQLAAEVAGRIVEKDPSVRSGNYVRKGQILYRVDPRDYQLEIERLKRRRDQELAAIEELQQEIENAENLLQVATEELALAEDEVKRFESMRAGISSAAELDQARRSRLTVLNQQVTLRNQIQAAETRRSRLELATKLAETEIEQAELNLERTVIRAPVDGRVVSEQVQANSYVQRGTQLMVIEDSEKVEVACNIRMDQLSWILDQPSVSTDRLVQAAQTSRFELPKTPVTISYTIAGRESATFHWEGVLDRLDGAGLDPQSRTFPILIRVDRPGEFRTSDGQTQSAAGPPMLVRGMFVDAVIKTRPTTPLMLVPKLAIKPASEASVIWKFSEDRQVIHQTPKALQAIAAYDKAKDEGRIDKLFPNAADADMAESQSDTSNETTPVDPQHWDAGRLEIVSSVRLVSGYWENTEIEYWICEVPDGQLTAGDRVIISPLPGVRADGSDAVRVRRQTSTELAKGDRRSAGA